MMHENGLRGKQERTWEAMRETKSQKGCHGDTGPRGLWVMKRRQPFVT